MFDTNEYFDGKVKSIAFASQEGNATIGVMAPGEYEFATSSIEVMTIVSGKLMAMLPDENEWKVYKKFESFVVPKDTTFKVKVDSDVSYLCLYK